MYEMYAESVETKCLLHTALHCSLENPWLQNTPERLSRVAAVPVI